MYKIYTINRLTFFYFFPFYPHITFAYLIDFNDMSPVGVILCQEVRELYTSYIYIYIFVHIFTQPLHTSRMQHKVSF